MKCAMGIFADSLPEGNKVFKSSKLNNTTKQHMHNPSNIWPALVKDILINNNHIDLAV